MNSPTMFLLFLDINRRRIAVETAAGTFPFTGFDDSICCSQPGFTFKGIAAAAAAFRQNFGNLFFPRFLSFLAVRLYSRDRVPLAFDRFLSTRSASAIFPWGRGAGGGGGREQNFAGPDDDDQDAGQHLPSSCRECLQAGKASNAAILRFFYISPRCQLFPSFRASSRPQFSNLLEEKGKADRKASAGSAITPAFLIRPLAFFPDHGELQRALCRPIGKPAAVRGDERCFLKLRTWDEKCATRPSRPDYNC